MPWRALLVIGLLCSAAPASRADEVDYQLQGKIPPPMEVRVSAELDREEYFLGENVLLHFRVRNNGTSSIPVFVGGDYRGSPRATRYVVTAKAADGGKPVPDPYPNPMNMGGIGGGQSIAPGKMFEDSIPLMRYVHFPEPGEYIVRVAHDLGWTPTPDGPAAVAETRIKLVMPTADEADQLFDAVLALPERDATMGKRSADYGDLSVMRYPVYLPRLRREAGLAPPAAPAGAGGKPAAALEAIARMPDPAAIDALLEMADAARGNGDAQGRVARALSEHLPATADDKQWRGENRFPADLTWDAKFGPRVRALAKEMLESDAGPTIASGAALILRVGANDDLTPITRALDRTIPRTIGEPMTDHIFSDTRNTIASLTHAANALTAKGGNAAGAAVGPAEPQTPGEIVVYLGAVASRANQEPLPPPPVPPEALERMAGWMRHSIPYIRESALRSMPVPPPQEVRDRLPSLVDDADVNVRLAAAGLAQRAKETSCKDALVERLAEAPSKWEIDAMAYALDEMGLQFDAWRGLAGRLDDPKLVYGLVARLSHVVKDAGGSSGRTDTDPAEALRLKKRWGEWLAQHEAEIRAGKRFAVGDAALTADLFPPGFQVNTPQGDWPPAPKP